MPSYISIIAVILVGAVAVMVAMPKTHSEEALMSDWSDPPPFPIFIALNVLASIFQSMADALTPPPVAMIGDAFVYQKSVLANICQKFRIPDFLSTGPKTITQIAEYTQTDDALVIERIMFAMASNGMTQLDPTMKEGDEPRFVNTALSAVLRRDHPNSVAGFVGHVVDDGFESFGYLEKLLGPSPVDNEKPMILWDLVHTDEKYQGGKIWKFFEDYPEREEQFTRAMNALEGLGGKAMAADVPFEKFDRVIDIGGSRGHFLHKILSENPEMKGVLLDRPEVIVYARPLWLDDDGDFALDDKERIQIIEGNFFEATDLPKAKDGDAFLLRYILHDWGAEDCATILSNLADSMKGTNATLFLGESAIPSRHTGPSPMKVPHNIDMLMLNLFRTAIERTPEMWHDLLDGAGFEMHEIHSTRSVIHFVEASLKA
mmetsp:Transcript_35815/g.86405  ORF Transcript_35815/g.86405 Transcript_35815/m.86405 type:complete len:431 (-) Transcript_35815:122-1414(-)|eukprot:CAMPEP_0113479824 /NCGR_PEP_ID=MMETSP0014_2-20120614/21532_1 /TAXON_ID=2857 /ORGANISM="Nitzschia sp." /LENGTH=430 /DNA_ID=CAMNT_0000373181 /DNA_START=191 /DNA_END=1483 /DNA_ORIENTATION=+ /assembly_acc=CAM_ASM_000159